MKIFITLAIATVSIFVIYSCIFQPRDHHFSIELIDPNGDLVYRIEETNILCVDWANQSYLFDSITRNNLALIALHHDLCFLPYKLHIKHNESLKSEILFLCPISSHQPNFDELPTVFFSSRNKSMIHDEWLHIRWHTSYTKPVNYERNRSQIFDEEVFNTLKKQQKLICSNWALNEDITPINQPSGY